MSRELSYDVTPRSMTPRSTVFVVAFCAGALTSLAPPALAAGAAEVNFIESERYTDAGNTAVARERALNTLDEHLRQLAARLPVGQTLRVEVLDIDLAGAQLSISANAPRVMRGGRGDWPQIRLRWWLLEGGRVLRNGEEQLVDLNYLAPSQTNKALAGELPHEKRMLDRWFAETFSSERQ